MYPTGQGAHHRHGQDFMPRFVGIAWYKAKGDPPSFVSVPASFSLQASHTGFSYHWPFILRSSR
jgi:hypothetical protein